MGERTLHCMKASRGFLVTRPIVISNQKKICSAVLHENRLHNSLGSRKGYFRIAQTRIRETLISFSEFSRCVEAGLADLKIQPRVSQWNWGVSMTKGEETRLRNLQAKKLANKKLTPLDLHFLKKLAAKKKQEDSGLVLSNSEGRQ